MKYEIRQTPQTTLKTALEIIALSRESFYSQSCKISNFIHQIMSCTIDVFNLHMKIHLRWSTVAIQYCH